MVTGQLFEEAAEACNKEYNRLKLHHTRKSSRINTNTDLFQMMLVSYDPIISSLQKQGKKKMYELLSEVKYLLDFEFEQEEIFSNRDTDKTGENNDLELDISSLRYADSLYLIFVKLTKYNNKICIKIILAC